MKARTLGLHRGQSVRARGVEAGWVTETSRADSGATVRIRRDIEDDIVGTRWVARHAAYAGEVIESQVVANPPRDVVIGAGSIAADTHGTDDPLTRSVQSQTASENIYPANLVPDHRVLRGTDVRRVAAIGVFGIDWVAVLQAEEAATRLHRGI